MARADSANLQLCQVPNEARKSLLHVIVSLHSHSSSQSTCIAKQLVYVDATIIPKSIMVQKYLPLIQPQSYAKSCRGII